MYRALLPLGLAVLYSNPAWALPPASPSQPAPERAQAPAVWTLPVSMAHARATAPELQAAQASVAARDGELAHAAAWPNPSIDLDVNDRLGMEDGRGGINLTRVGISQPIPLQRIARQRVAAEAGLESAQAELRYQQLLLEREVARAFHTLQLAAAKRQLAEERLQQVSSSPDASRPQGMDRLVRYLPPLERQRLSILEEEARQAASVAERLQQQALIDFRTLLGLPASSPVTPAPLALPDAPPPLDTLARNLDAHPAIQAALKASESAQAGVEVAASQRYADPTLSLYQERNYLAGQRRDVRGIALNMEVPLWSRSDGMVAKAGADAMRMQTQLDLARRDARRQLDLAHARLTRLLDQAARMRSNLLDPARSMFVLARRSFAAGEVNVLTLVDASNTYFDSLARFHELQQECALAAADLRLAAGISLLETEPEVKP